MSGQGPWILKHTSVSELVGSCLFINQCKHNLFFNSETQIHLHGSECYTVYLGRKVMGGGGRRNYCQIWSLSREGMRVNFQWLFSIRDFSKITFSSFFKIMMAFLPCGGIFFVFPYTSSTENLVIDINTSIVQ